jgi:hypothetical protein
MDGKDDPNSTKPSLLYKKIRFENMSFVKMESSKLINYLTNICGSGQGTRVVTEKVINK